MKQPVSLVMLGIVTMLVTACDPSAPLPKPTVPTDVRASSHAVGGHAGGHAAVADESINRQLDELRRLVAPFHNFDKAVEFGYDIPAPAPGVCISDPVRGGMGFHYTSSRKDLINDGEVNLLEPEFLVYSPKPNGGVKFSALDYFVPYATWPHADPPSLLGIPFAREDAFQAYVLHIWLFWHNPAGLFENYNPAVPLC